MLRKRAADLFIGMVDVVVAVNLASFTSSKKRTFPVESDHWFRDASKPSSTSQQKR
jgi:hypothetical protein